MVTGSIIALDFCDTSEEDIRANVDELIDRIRNQYSSPTTAHSITPETTIFVAIRVKYLIESQNKTYCE